MITMIPVAPHIIYTIFPLAIFQACPEIDKAGKTTGFTLR
ncbi:hypothetical protein HMPREF0574_0875 [Mobiluncus curtisii subsp. curtisii ATCC 35241]|uniref:Uncharacterized protein n=2 Tax=Mobiluncus TaxID=2050 RepID=D6ZKP2_MOBCV|nr:hypothetical protein HMPREF0573_10972 [Mobiluncus curtisii ATCC 43063]EFL93869.1 hypothetical protein HMPREF0574_0875 [Mobiluncus curtisii subsp. curtisii ATCC 35241]EFU81483.1 hypothetical protein HMPREF0576_1325 [Mobiluncus holmesii ATCC 35242]